MAPRISPRYERIDVPHRFINLAQRRTEFLFHIMTYGDQPVRLVLASAYLQGVGDAADAIDAKNARGAKAEPPNSLHC